MYEANLRSSHDLLSELMEECEEFADHDPERAEERFRWLLETEWDRYGDIVVDFVVEEAERLYLDGRNDSSQ